ncbi:MAG: DNA/RNA nuclease SfsA [Myxococcota bacterium]
MAVELHTKLTGLPLVQLRSQPLHARFLERPNRFVAHVRLRNGQTVKAHLPNPGRLTGTLSDGCAVLLDGPHPGRQCPFTMVAAREGKNTWVGTVTTYANRVFPVLHAARLFPELPRGTLRPEVVHGASRFDFALSDGYVELKSVTLARDGTALFPDAVTERGARHCDELGALARKGAQVAVVFVAQRADVDAVAPEDEIDPEFGKALRRAARRGVKVMACALELGVHGAIHARRIPVLM